MKKLLCLLICLTALSSSALAVGRWSKCSDWADYELTIASSENLVPDTMNGADLTQNITRQEFASVAVNLYETFTGKKALLSDANPFTDTTDGNVSRAYRLGITTGTSDTTFSPDMVLTREQTATMLARVFQKVFLREGDALPYNMPTAFTDQYDISDWANNSVYFMYANSIINGVADGVFAPKATATREQAIIIASRMYDSVQTRMSYPISFVASDGNTYTRVPEAYKVYKVNDSYYVYDRSLELTFKGYFANLSTLSASVIYNKDFYEIYTPMSGGVAYQTDTHFYYSLTEDNIFAPIYEDGIFWSKAVMGGSDFAVGGVGEAQDTMITVQQSDTFDECKKSH